MVIMACDDMVTMWSDCVFAMEKDVAWREEVRRKLGPRLIVSS
jgi:hypothetical protein